VFATGAAPVTLAALLLALPLTAGATAGPLPSGSNEGLALPLESSVRPSLCRDKDSAPEPHRRSELWDRARLRAVDELCRGLARANAELDREPSSSLRVGLELARAWPGRPEPQALTARALTRLGRHADAWLAFEAAQARGHVNKPDRALRDYAVAAALTGHHDAALDAYRRLITLGALWPDPTERHAVYLEAALAALRAPAGTPADAASYVARVRSEGASTGLGTYAAAVALLIAERQGRSTRAADGPDSPEIWHFLEQLRSSEPARHWPRVFAHEPLGAAALAIEPFSEAEAAELWSAYVKGLNALPGAAEWKQRALERLRRLEGQGSGAP
jgi:hypothetical protein